MPGATINQLRGSGPGAIAATKADIVITDGADLMTRRTSS
jgi:hypothetical protein